MIRYNITVLVSVLTLACKFSIDTPTLLFLLNFHGLTAARNVLFSLTKRGLAAGHF
jgi:hypothetical protein